MSTDQAMNGNPTWRLGWMSWGLLGACLLIGAAAFFEPLAHMTEVWNGSEEYGYAYLIPIVTMFLIWQKRPALQAQPARGSWAGSLITAVGILVYFLGVLSSIYVVAQYAVLIVVLGIVLALIGWPGFRVVAAPLILLAFMIPLPRFLYQSLSTSLQLISSEVGVAVIRLFDISVHLEGNVIDLGTYKLQVAEACSGLRYLFPLTALSFIAAYIFQGRVWKKVVIFLSSIPVTIAMNSFRIGAIGVLVEHWGIEQAEGFLHYFEGWVIFMACMVILVMEMWLLSKLGGDRTRSLGEAFALQRPKSAAPGSPVRYARAGGPMYLSAVVLVAAMAGSAALEGREEKRPERLDFSAFPMEMNFWTGRRDALEPIYLDALKLDDYLIANFRNGSGERVNLYVAYYGSQRAGVSAHSPRSCIPGGGWQIVDLSRRSLGNAEWNGTPLAVNRVLIRKGAYKQLVYYWFQQRGRNLTSEYLVKWYLFWDSLTRARTDGALVRLTTMIEPGDSVMDADRRLKSFADAVVGRLHRFIPE